MPGLIGIAIDSSVNRVEDATTIAQLADAHEIDFVTVPDHPYLPKELEAWTLLTMLAARTQRVSVGTNVASLALRPPAMLIKAASTLSVLTGGRVILGLGAGGPLAEIAGFGGAARSTGESVAALEDALRMIKGFRGGDSARHDGPYYSFGHDRFGPVQRIPLWLGAFGPRMLALTGQYADAWLPTNAYLELADVPDMQRRVDDGALAAGRDPAAVGRVFNVLGQISDTEPEQNGRRLVGPAGFWVEALHEYRDRLRFDSFVFWPVGGDRVAQTKTFLEEVRPRL
jgi:alkanesulfonate monooxygenase SsuD/methylene tetrahydromethanopterin reductase-like flavin-dependent oxidoreductase (luciferase family)